MLTANLAVSFARGLQQFVMAMDCHLMDPIVHELFKVPRHPGLTDFLEHGASVPEIIHRTGVDKLTVIPAGTPSQRSAEILATDKMAGLMQELRARYRDRYILLDTPPVQAFDDPAVLARLVEGIIFVVRAGSTDRELVLRALRGLPEEKIVGVVLNDVHGAVVDATAVGAADVEG
jgi:capsular exopolysaccharide synthesis family protein